MLRAQPFRIVSVKSNFCVGGGESARSLGTGCRDAVDKQDLRHREHCSCQQISFMRAHAGSRFEPAHDLPRLHLHDCQSEVAWKFPLVGCGDIS